MAKTCRTEKYTKATIDRGNNTITEYTKDDTRVYSLTEFIERWTGVENVNISFSTDEEIESME